MNNLTPGPPKTVKSAPTVYCYICGRQFGSKSISIHEPQCMKKWHAENAKLPKNMRRAAPLKPSEVIGIDGEIDQEATNEALWKSSQGVMLECENCGRKFKNDRLPVHQRSCTPSNPAKKVPMITKRTASLKR